MEATIAEPLVDPRGNFGLQSPDGRYALFVVQRGEPATLANVGDLYLVDVSAPLSNAKAVLIAHFPSTSRYAPIAALRWASDSQKVYFLGARGDAVPQVFEERVASKALRQISREPTAVTWFDLASTANVLVLVPETLADPPSLDKRCLREGCLVNAKSLSSAEAGVPDISYPLVVINLKTGHRQTIGSPESSYSRLSDCYDELLGGLSPNGRYGVRRCRLKPGAAPDWWRDYTIVPDFREKLKAGNTSLARQWILLDFRKQTQRPLSTAPEFSVVGNPDYTTKPIWLDNGEKLLQIGAVEPLTALAGEAKARAAGQLVIREIDIASLATRVVALLPRAARTVVHSDWDERHQTLTVQSADSAGRALSVLTVRRVAGKWIQGDSASLHTDAATRLRIVLAQGLNTPPVVTINDGKGRSRQLLELDPWLRRYRLGHVEAFAWRSNDHRRWQGNLYYPPSYTAKRRYPLVIQTHGYFSDPHAFALSGVAANFAAQALAARGIVVLQARENVDLASGVSEANQAQAGYESAINALAARKVIDPARVGIQGWSRTGWYVGSLLTKSHRPIAAAALTESADFGWWYYVAQSGQTGESEYGAAPYGAGLKVWVDNAPTFHLDRVSTPVFLWSASSMVGLWDWYAILNRLNKPVEYWYLPDGAHVPFRMEDRIRMGEMLVDWFDFWLQGHEDFVPAKVDQYRRWEKLCDLQISRSAGHTSLCRPTAHAR